MTEKSLRDEFEKWCKSVAITLDIRRTDFRGEPYAKRDTAIAWLAWQAAWNYQNKNSQEMPFCGYEYQINPGRDAEKLYQDIRNAQATQAALQPITQRAVTLSNGITVTCKEQEKQPECTHEWFEDTNNGYWCFYCGAMMVKPPIPIEP